MAYYSGSAVDITALRTVLVDACASEGWAWSAGDEVLSKGPLYVRLQVISGYLVLTGRTSISNGDAPYVVRMGTLSVTPITYPASYEIFCFEQEVFMVVRYSVDFFQFCGFGKSTLEDLPGTGMWVAATLGQSPASNGVNITAVDGGSDGLDRACPALFWSTVSAQNTARMAHLNYWVHSDLDGQGWWGGLSALGAQPGVASIAPLIGLLPNNWNSEAVLLPIRSYKIRPSSKVSLTADLINARYTRVDNYEPGQVITIGSEQWKIFPFYRKDVANRNGGTGNHSGTFGWAIRYEAP